MRLAIFYMQVTSRKSKRMCTKRTSSVKESRIAMINVFKESLVHVWYPVTDCSFQVNNLTELETHLLQIGAVDLHESMCSSNSALTKMGLDGGWQIVYQAKPLDIHLWALNISRQYQRSWSQCSMRVSNRRNGLVSIGIIRKDDINNVWGWTFLLCHRIEAGLQDRWLCDNGMSRNQVIGWCFECRIYRATELPWCSQDQ